MPVSMCGSCERLISISQVAGGNPTALEDPQTWATVYGHCDRCQSLYCDRCLRDAAGKCPGCGHAIALQGPPAGQPRPRGPSAPQSFRPAPQPSPAPATPRPQSRTSPGSFKLLLGSLWKIAIAPAVVAIAVLFTSPGSTPNTVLWAILNLQGVGVSGLFVGPVIGLGTAFMIGRPLEGLLGIRRMVVASKIWMFVYGAGLLVLPWLLYQARLVWHLRAWTIAYLAALIGGTLVSGLWTIRNRTRANQRILAAL